MTKLWAQAVGGKFIKWIVHTGW